MGWLGLAGDVSTDINNPTGQKPIWNIKNYNKYQWYYKTTKLTDTLSIILKSGFESCELVADSI